MKIAALTALAVCGCTVEARDYGDCLLTQHRPAHTELVPKMMDPLNPVRIGGMSIRNVPARDVCVLWEYPKGDGPELNSGK